MNSEFTGLRFSARGGYRPLKPPSVKIVKSFSFTENLATLTNLDQRFPVTSCLEGLRTLSMQWVVIGHTVLVMATGKIDNSSYVFRDVVKRFSMQPIINATVSVDSFFTISGFLLAYVTLRKLRKRRTRGMGAISFPWR